MNAACRAIRPLLSAYMDNEITPDELRTIGAHVATCAECAATLAEYREMRVLVRALPQPLPPTNLQGAVFARATPTYRRRAAWIEFGQQALAIGALAVAIIAIVLTGSLVMRQSAVGAGIPALDRTPPIVTAWVPEPGNANSRLNQPVRITFSEPMNQGSVLAALQIKLPAGDDAERARLLASARWDGTTLVLGEGGSLQPDTDYTIDLDPNVARDTAGNNLRGVTQGYSFRTSDVIALASPVAASPVAASPVVTPTATAEPSPQPTPTKDLRGDFPTSPSAPPLAPTATTAPRVTPTATQAPVIAQPPPTQAQNVPNNPPVAPTATPVPPTATPQPTQQPAPPPTVAPTATAPTVAPTTTVPAATATAAPPSPTLAPKLPYEVVGGFGQIYTRNGPVRDRIGLPTAAETKGAGTYQLFEGGMMFWREDTATIYVLFAEEPGIWYAFADGWTTGMEPGGGAGPVAGQFKPQRGFGKVWREQPEVQKRLGYALSADEIGTTLVIQPFEHGLMVWTTASGKPMISVLYENNTYERYEDASK
jgi:outer membrane biosynthesis protein TonB